MCSQPIVQEAQLCRATFRIAASSSAASAGAWSKVDAWKFRVGSVLIALKASRLASVPSSRYFAVAGPNDRARRSRAAASTASRVGRGDLGRGADRDGLDPFGAQHRAEPAAAGVPPVVGDRGVPDAALARRADRRHPPAAAQPLPQPGRRLPGGEPGQVRGVFEARARRRR